MNVVIDNYIITDKIIDKFDRKFSLFKSAKLILLHWINTAKLFYSFYDSTLRVNVQCKCFSFKLLVIYSTDLTIASYFMYLNGNRQRIIVSGKSG